MTIQELMDLWQQQAQASGGSAASVTPASMQANRGAVSAPSNVNLPPVNNGVQPNDPGNVVNFAPEVGSLLFGPAGFAGGELFSLGGNSINSALGGRGPQPTVSNLFGGGGLEGLSSWLWPLNSAFFGVPREAKSSALAGALGGSGNPIDELIGQFVGKGVGQGHVLSESGGSSFGNSVGRLAEMLQALSGNRASPVTASGFDNNPTYTPPSFGGSLKNFQLPAGDQFVNDPNALARAAQIIERMTGMDASGISGKQGQAEWQKVLSQLSSQGLLQKYQGSLGAPGGTTPGSSGIPNISLPHPLTQQNTAAVAPPYPVQ